VVVGGLEEPNVSIADTGLGFEVWGMRFGVWGLGFGDWCEYPRKLRSGCRGDGTRWT